PQNLRCARARLIRHADNVFDRDRHTAERQIHIGLFRLFEGIVEVYREIGIDLRLYFLDPEAKRFQNFPRRNFAPTKKRLQLADIQRRQIGRLHSITFVTMKRPFAWRGALLNASSAVSPARGSSSRKILKTGTACAAAST